MILLSEAIGVFGLDRVEVSEHDILRGGALRLGRPRLGSCPGWDSNPHSPCGPVDFKSTAYANSATRANQQRLSNMQCFSNFCVATVSKG